MMDYTSAQHSGPSADRQNLRRAGLACAVAAACAVALLVSAVAATAATAAVGKYTVWSCRNDAGVHLSSKAWTLNNPAPAPELTVGDDCETATTPGTGALSLTLAPTAATAASAFYSFDAPANTTIADYELRRSLQTFAAPDTDALYRYKAFVRERVNADTFTDYGCVSIGGLCLTVGSILDPFDLLADTSLFDKQLGQNLSSVQLWVSCGSETCDPVGGIGARARLFGSQVTLNDTSPPSGLTASGSLLGATANGVATLQVHANDLGGGIASATATVDGGTAKTWSAGPTNKDCNAPYTAKVPCPLAADATFAVDTTALQDGHHVASVTVTDVAGNTTTSGVINFSVDNTNPPVVITQAKGNGSPAVTTPILTFKAASLVRPRGTGTAASGLLSTDTGVPIAGATLAVSSVQLATDQLEEQKLPDVKTGDDGTFTVPVQSDGAQLLRVEFTPNAGSAVTASASVSVRTETAVAFKTSKKRLKRGHKVTLSGQLLGAGQSAAGTTATIQAIVRGKWRPVGSATVNASGKFAWSYKFVALHRPTLFSFRAVVVRTPGWPWPTTTSGRLHVKVTL